MFTGIVETVGRIRAIERVEGGARLRVEAPDLVPRLAPGESVSTAGVCLTVGDVDGETFTADAVTTTLSRTTLGEREPGDAVNLERAVRAGKPLGGHLVQGHVDEVAEVVSLSRSGATVTLAVRVGPAVARVTVDRGSLAVDGVSLTVARIAADVAEFAIIPYTWSHTTLSGLAVGSRVNVEADLIGKYVRRLSAPYRGADGPPRSESP